MKTTFDIPEPLLRDIQKTAKKRGTTAKSVVEQALRQLLDRERQAPAIRLRDASVDGHGLQAEFENAEWADIRDAAYDRESMSATRSGS